MAASNRRDFVDQENSLHDQLPPQYVDSNNNTKEKNKINGEEERNMLPTDSGKMTPENDSQCAHADGDNNETDPGDQDMVSEQRSQSDFELDAGDDFSEEEEVEEEEGDLNDEIDGDKVVGDISETDTDFMENNTEPMERLGGRRQGAHADDMNMSAALVSEHPVNYQQQRTSPCGDDQTTGLSSPGNETGSPVTDDGNAGSRELSDRELFLKLQNPDVIESSNVTGSLKDINASNLGKLLTMDKSDPAVQRLFQRPRLTAKEVTKVNIDTDIKAMVNEFLRTNITGNFIIARVLRENYATFYSWLATQLQVERNAWAARLKLALDNMEEQRIDNLAIRSFVEESAVQLWNLHQSCKAAMFDVVGKNYLTNEKTTAKFQSTLRKAVHKSRGVDIEQCDTRSTSPSVPDTVSVGQFTSPPKTELALRDPKKGNGFSGTRETETDLDDPRDWKQVTRESIKGLNDICETLVNDRTDCLRIVGVTSNNSASLVDSFAAYASNNQAHEHSERGKEIEGRLCELETENKKLLQEITTLQNTLRDKINDTLSLQQQLNRMETLVRESSILKVKRSPKSDDSVTMKGVDCGFRVAKFNLSLCSCGKANLNKIPNPSDRWTQSISGFQVRIPQSKQVKGTKVAQSMKKDDKSIITASKSEEDVESADYTMTVHANGALQPAREQSLNEIYEVKMRTLKRTANELEDSFHQVITGMDKFNKSVLQEDNACYINSASASTTAATASKSSGGNRNAFISGNAAALQVNGSNKPVFNISISRTGPVAKQRSMCSTHQNATKEPKITAISKEAKEPVLLCKKNTPLSHPSTSDHSQMSSGLKSVVDKLNEASSESIRLNCDEEKQYREVYGNGYNSNDKHRCNKCRGEYTSNLQRNYQPCVSSSKNKTASAISRWKPLKGVVTKCLRCQKLFSSVDNHKLACRYHPKERERMEYYDRLGRLISVIYNWTCCLQPYEAEGCSFGQHV